MSLSMFLVGVVTTCCAACFNLHWVDYICRAVVKVGSGEVHNCTHTKERRAGPVVHPGPKRAALAAFGYSPSWLATRRGGCNLQPARTSMDGREGKRTERGTPHPSIKPVLSSALKLLEPRRDQEDTPGSVRTVVT